MYDKDHISQVQVVINEYLVTNTYKSWIPTFGVETNNGG